MIPYLDLLYLRNVLYLTNGGIMNPNEIRQSYMHKIRTALLTLSSIRGEIFTAVTDGDQSLYEARRALRNCIALLDTADDEAFLQAIANHMDFLVREGGETRVVKI